MHIHCTKKLLDQLKIKPEQVDEGTPLTSWHANFLTINRKKTLVLVNDQNRYVIVLHGLKAKDFKKLDENILHSIRITFEQEGIKNDVIEQFIHSSEAFAYSKTKDRKLVARLNKACEMLTVFQELLDPESIDQTALNMRISRFFVGDGKKDYFKPNEKLYEDLEALAGTPIIQTKGIEMKVTLRLSNFNVYRKLVVPMNFSFHQLHDALQIAFNWKHNHLHAFYIFDHKNDGAVHKPILNLVCNQEALSFGNDAIPMKMDTQIKLADYAPATITYIYDFGDDWVHDIEMGRVIEDYDKNYPICLEGEGKTPPEDVGGEGGYEHFLKILADKDHPDYEHMQSWSGGLSYQDFDMERINRRLENM